MKLLFIILTLIFISGCGTSMRNTSTAIVDYNSDDYAYLFVGMTEREKQIEIRIRKGLISVGMSKAEVLLSWGNPRDINRSSFGDQWVYYSSIRSIQHKRKYLHFDNNDLLTSWSSID